MALITICGYPCSGKSTRALQIKSDLEKRLKDLAETSVSSVSVAFKTVSILSDDALHFTRDVYNASRSEKTARAALFATAQRQMARDTVLLIDSLNYIKGFRYQLYCAARELSLRVCTVYVVAPPEMCRARNSARLDGRVYAPDTLENLIARFEEPSSMVRWDSPLVTIPWTDDDVAGASAADAVWRAITTSTVKPPNVGTQVTPKAPSNALHTLEQTASSIVSAIMATQASGSHGGPISFTLPYTSSPPSSSSSSSSSLITRPITLPARHITLSELLRLKRQFVAVHTKAITLGTTEKGALDWSAPHIADKFVSYLEEHLRPS